MTAAEQILDALKLVVGKDVNEYAIPVINTIIKNHESAQLSAKEQECEKLKAFISIAVSPDKAKEIMIHVTDVMSELSSLRAENESLRREALEREAAISMYVKREAIHYAFAKKQEIEISKLKERIGKGTNAAIDKSIELNELRKRCEDLEQKVISRDKIINNYGVKGRELQKRVEDLEGLLSEALASINPAENVSLCADIRKLLNQIKS